MSKRIRKELLVLWDSLNISPQSDLDIRGSNVEILLIWQSATLCLIVLQLKNLVLQNQPVFQFCKFTHWDVLLCAFQATSQ